MLKYRWITEKVLREKVELQQVIYAAITAVIQKLQSIIFTKKI